MNITRWNLMGLALMALLLNGPLAQAGGAPVGAIPNLNTHLNIPAHPATATGKKLNTNRQLNINRPLLHGLCPKLVAGNLHIIRTVPQSGNKYKFMLDGTIINRGAAGMATAGFNVTQGVQGRPGGKRIALKLFNKQVRRNDTLTINRDFDFPATPPPVQSDAMTREQANHTVFTLAVTNLRNGKGLCGEYNPTKATVTSAQVSRALPVQIHGGVASHQVDTIHRNNTRTNLANLVKPKPRFGRGKPVTGPGGKPLLPPKTGTRHLLHGGHTRLDGHTRPGGFAGVPGADRPHLNKPLTGPGGKSLLPNSPRIPGLGKTHLNKPLTGPGGKSLLPNWTGDLAIVDIKNVTLYLHDIPPGRSGVDFHDPESIVIVVSVKNFDPRTASSPRRLLRVSVEGLREYIPFQVRSNRQYFPDSLSHFMFCRDPKCSQVGGGDIPSIPPLQQRDVAVRITGILGYSLWEMDASYSERASREDASRGYHLGWRYAGGYYMCPTDAHDLLGSLIRIRAEVDTHGDGRPGNNGMRRDVSFGGLSVVECEATATSALTPYRPTPR